VKKKIKFYLTSKNRRIRYSLINQEKGLVLISYTDDADVKYWEKIYKKDKKPYPLLTDELHKQANSLFFKNNKMNEEIPKPLIVLPFLWNAGCYAYKKNYYGDDSMQFFLKPYTESDIYTCNSGYSNQQAWMNGGLKMANELLNLI